MRKTFEAFLVLIIFYGVYSAFNQIAPMITPELSAFWVVIIALIVAALLLVLYAQVIASSARQKLKERVSELQNEILKKDKEIKIAGSFKESVIKEAEQTLDQKSKDIV